MFITLNKIYKIKTTFAKFSVSVSIIDFKNEPIEHIITAKHPIENYQADSCCEINLIRIQQVSSNLFVSLIGPFDETLLIYDIYRRTITESFTNLISDDGISIECINDHSVNSRISSKDITDSDSIESSNYLVPFNQFVKSDLDLNQLVLNFQCYDNKGKISLHQIDIINFVHLPHDFTITYLRIDQIGETVIIKLFGDINECLIIYDIISKRLTINGQLRSFGGINLDYMILSNNAKISLSNMRPNHTFIQLLSLFGQFDPPILQIDRLSVGNIRILSGTRHLVLEIYNSKIHTNIISVPRMIQIISENFFNDIALDSQILVSNDGNYHNITDVEIFASGIVVCHIDD
jgi:hypothetical protein